MGLLDGPLRSVVKTIVSDIGLGATQAVFRVTEHVYDIELGSTIPKDTDYAVRVVLTEYADVLIDGTNVKRGDRKALIAAASLSITPKVVSGIDGDTVAESLVIGSEVFRVVGGKTIMSGDEAAAFELQVRK